MTNEAWNRIRPKTEKPNTLRCPSADIIVRYMKESNDYCTFHFSRHYLTIRLRARDFYAVIVDEGEARINYHRIEIESE